MIPYARVLVVPPAILLEARERLSKMVTTFLCQAHNSNDATGTRTNHILFSVSNLGKTTNKVDQLYGLVVGTIEILESYVVVITREDTNNYDSAKRIRVSNDGINFQEACFHIITVDSLKGTIIQKFETDKSLFQRREIYTKTSLDNGKG